MKYILVIILYAAFCIMSYADGISTTSVDQDNDILIINSNIAPNADTIYIHDIINGEKIYGDTIDGTQYFDAGDSNTVNDLFKRNSDVVIKHDENGLYIDVRASIRNNPKDAIRVELNLAKLSEDNHQYTPGKELILNLIRIDMPQQNMIEKSALELLLLAIIILSLVISVLQFVKVRKLGVMIKKLQLCTLSSEQFVELLGNIKPNEYFKEEIMSAIRKFYNEKVINEDNQLTTVNAILSSSAFYDKIEEIVDKNIKNTLKQESILNGILFSSNFKVRIQDIVDNAIKSEMDKALSPEHKTMDYVQDNHVQRFVTNKVTYDKARNCFYPDDMSQGLFDIYEQGGQYYFTLSKSESVRKSLIQGIGYYDCISIEDNRGCRIIEPISYGKLNYIHDVYYVDPANKLKVKIE